MWFWAKAQLTFTHMHLHTICMCVDEVKNNFNKRAFKNIAQGRKNAKTTNDGINMENIVLWK